MVAYRITHNYMTSKSEAQLRRKTRWALVRKTCAFNQSKRVSHIFVAYRVSRTYMTSAVLLGLGVRVKCLGFRVLGFGLRV